jgi:hypothetical protein
MFSEEYQTEFFKQYFAVFDAFRNKGVIGEVSLFSSQSCAYFIILLSFHSTFGTLLIS